MEIKIYKRDETDYWLDEDLKAKAGKILGVYLFVPTLHVHLCELAPSYELHHVGAVISGTPEFEALSDEQRDAVFEALRDGIRDDDPVTYVHVSDVERLPTLEHDTDTSAGVTTLGDWGDAVPDPRTMTEAQTNEAIEAAREYLCGNGYVDT